MLSVTLLLAILTSPGVYGAEEDSNKLIGPGRDVPNRVLPVDAARHSAAWTSVPKAPWATFSGACLWIWPYFEGVHFERSFSSEVSLFTNFTNNNGSEVNFEDVEYADVEYADLALKWCKAACIVTSGCTGFEFRTDGSLCAPWFNGACGSDSAKTFSITLTDSYRLYLLADVANTSEPTVPPSPIPTVLPTSAAPSEHPSLSPTKSPTTKSTSIPTEEFVKENVAIELGLVVLFSWDRGTFVAEDHVNSIASVFGISEQSVGMAGNSRRLLDSEQEGTRLAEYRLFLMSRAQADLIVSFVKETVFRQRLADALRRHSDDPALREITVLAAESEIVGDRSCDRATMTIESPTDDSMTTTIIGVICALFIGMLFGYFGCSWCLPKSNYCFVGGVNEAGNHLEREGFMNPPGQSNVEMGELSDSEGSQSIAHAKKRRSFWPSGPSLPLSVASKKEKKKRKDTDELYEPGTKGTYKHHLRIPSGGRVRHLSLPLGDNHKIHRSDRSVSEVSGIYEYESQGNNGKYEYASLVKQDTGGS